MQKQNQSNVGIIGAMNGIHSYSGNSSGHSNQMQHQSTLVQSQQIQPPQIQQQTSYYNNLANNQMQPSIVPTNNANTNTNTNNHMPLSVAHSNYNEKNNDYNNTVLLHFFLFFF